MAGESEEIYKRLSNVEKEVFSMSRQLTELSSEKPVQRLSLLEEAVRQVRSDVLTIEGISSEMSKKMGEGLERLEKQAAQSRGQIKGFLAAMSLLLVLINIWPLIREALKAAVL